MQKQEEWKWFRTPNNACVYDNLLRIVFGYFIYPHVLYNGWGFSKNKEIDTMNH
jgi:hypothetical protein